MTAMATGTKTAAKILVDLKLDQSRVLVVVSDINDDDARSFRNIDNVKVESVKGLNTYYLVFAEYVVFTKKSLNELIERMTDGKSKS